MPSHRPGIPGSDASDIRLEIPCLRQDGDSHYDRTVTVKGLSEREVAADKVIWPLSFNVVGNDLNAVYAEIERNTAAIREFLLDGGISEAEISVSLPTLSDKYAQEYGSNDRAYRYFSKNVVTVCTGNVETVLALMPKQSEAFSKLADFFRSKAQPVKQTNTEQLLELIEKDLSLTI